MNDPSQRINQVASGFMAAKILLAAAELRVFDQLRGAGGTLTAVTGAIGGSERGTEILLDALVALGFVSKSDGVYRVDPACEPFLVEYGPTHTLASLRHRNRLFRRWAFLEETITGRDLPAGFGERESLDDRGANESFIRAMYAASHHQVGTIVDHVDLAGVRTLADLGGGPGHYLAEFARRSPTLEPYLVDLPLTLDVARRIQSGTPEGARMHFVTWDFYAGDPPADLPAMDLVFISQVVHAESPERNRELLRRVRSITAPGGRVIVHERTVDESRTAPVEAALFAVNMLAMTPGGRTYTEGEIAAWGIAAGFSYERGERIDDRSFLSVFRRSA